jgi:DNA repair photolyase
MGLNKSTGNMYPWLTHTYNTIKGECPHGCTYCYCKRISKRFNSPQKPIHFDEKELKTDLGSGNFIFVGSSCDMFASDIPDEWIMKTLEYCSKFKNQYLFQSKNPARMLDYDLFMPVPSVVCTTLETNRWYPEIMRNSPYPADRASAMAGSLKYNYLTIEPIMDFDLDKFVFMIKECEPLQVNIGADSGRNKLPEPSAEKILELITELKKFTVIAKKTNLNRILLKT